MHLFDNFDFKNSKLTNKQKQKQVHYDVVLDI